MNVDEFAAYTEHWADEAPNLPAISVTSVSGPDRTLVLGSTRSGDTVHVYKHDGRLHAVFYRPDGKCINSVSGTDLPLVACVPDGYAFPERCDVSFAHMLRHRGFVLCFAAFDEAAADRSTPFAGKLISETSRLV